MANSDEISGRSETRSRVAVVDDHSMVAEGLGRIISGQDDFELAGLAAAGADPPALASVKAEVVDKSIYLQQNYHFGPLKILVYLKRYHDITISDAGVWNILKRLDMNRLPSSQRYKPHRKRWKRYEKPRPGNGVQIDDKFISPITGSRKQYYQFTAIDDCSRLRVLRIYDRLNQKSAIRFLDFVLEKLPFRVETIQADNGAEFQSSVHWHVLDRVHA